MDLIPMVCNWCKGRWQDTPGFVFKMRQDDETRCPYCAGTSVRPISPSSGDRT